MQFFGQSTTSITILLASGLFQSAASAAAIAADPGTVTAADCGCNHNGDAGRWRDALNPADRLADLCSHGGGCYQAEAGQMCVSGDLAQCGCAVSTAQTEQSWSGDWFLWSAVTCGGLSVTIT